MDEKYLIPFSAWAGPKNPKILFVGEAWGADEQEVRQPFIGESGKELWRMLGEAMPDQADLHASASDLHRWGLAWIRQRLNWLNACGVAFTNVFNFRPPGGNNIENICGPRSSVEKDYPHPPLRQSKYILEQYLVHLPRLEEEIRQSAPNLIVALGGTAAWALLGNPKIGAIRGAIAEGNSIAAGRKVLPTYHPSAILRQWDLRPIAVADLLKASKECQFPEIRRPKRTVKVNPIIDEVESFVAETILAKPKFLSVDTETANGLIRCIGFAPSVNDSFVVPFSDPASPSGSYWATEEEEIRAWQACKRLLESGLSIIGQNFLYDLQYLCKAGIRPKICAEDTMLLHHSIFPEMEKGLGFLGSIYTSEASWKLMNKRKTNEVEKKDE